MEADRILFHLIYDKLHEELKANGREWVLEVLLKNQSHPELKPLLRDISHVMYMVITRHVNELHTFERLRVSLLNETHSKREVLKSQESNPPG